tara:strand:+ start:695 stop:1585 length:891 start_codon:yes stop_codon:yes gene_type:complete
MQNNKPIWFNEDTYQTIKHNKVEPETIEINLDKKPIAKIMVCTPCHSDVSMHYTQAVLKFQMECMKQNILVSFSLLKSSLVTQGRNLCVAEFLNHKDNYDYLLFIDSDIDFESKTIFKMIGADKDIIACPYPMKMIDTDRMWAKLHQTDLIKTKDDLLKAGYSFPLKMDNKNDINIDHGVIEVSHAPTGCMLIKREVIEKMIKHHPELKIYQPTIVNGKETAKENFYNLFDTLHDVKTKRYFGEDFGFCQRWTDMGGKVYIYALDYITHVGEHQYCGRFYDQLEALKRVDVDKKIK